MSGYMDDYGAADARREKIRNRIILGLVAVLVVGGGLYFTFRNYKEKGQVTNFVQLLNEQKFKEAYATWGCTDAAPCRYYPFERFMEDWGPESTHKVAQLKVGRARSCDEGIIQVIEFPGEADVLLFVNSSDLSIGYAPWPVCNPRIPKPQ